MIVPSIQVGQFEYVAEEQEDPGIRSFKKLYLNQMQLRCVRWVDLPLRERNSSKLRVRNHRTALRSVKVASKGLRKLRSGLMRNSNNGLSTITPDSHRVTDPVVE